MAQSLGLKGDETGTIRGLQGDLKPRQTLTAESRVRRRLALRRVPLLCRNRNTLDELEYYRTGRHSAGTKVQAGGMMITPH